MKDYTEYFLMIREDDPVGTARDVIAYTLHMTGDSGMIDWDVPSMHAVIPDQHGNLNHVCRVFDAKGHSIYIKQAGDTRPSTGTARSRRSFRSKRRSRPEWSLTFISTTPS